MYPNANISCMWQGAPANSLANGDMLFMHCRARIPLSAYISQPHSCPIPSASILSGQLSWPLFQFNNVYKVPHTTGSQVIKAPMHRHFPGTHLPGACRKGISFLIDQHLGILCPAGRRLGPHRLGLPLQMLRHDHIWYGIRGSCDHHPHSLVPVQDLPV